MHPDRFPKMVGGPIPVAFVAALGADYGLLGGGQMRISGKDEHDHDVRYVIRYSHVNATHYAVDRDTFTIFTSALVLTCYDGLQVAERFIELERSIT